MARSVYETGFTDPAAVYATNLGGSEDLGFSHNLEWMAAEANAVIDSAVAEGQPFFLYFTPTAPHSAGAVLSAMSDFGTNVTPAGVLASAPEPGMMHTREEIRAMVAGSTDPEGDAGVIWVDDSLGSLMAKMESLSVLDDTLIIVTMDHGMMGKGTLAEGATRVALMARMPALIGAGTTMSRPVINIDLAPTILQFAGIVAPSDHAVDGKSWWSMVATENDEVGLAALACRCSIDSVCSTEEHHTEWCYVDSLNTCEDAVSDGGDPWSELACQQAVRRVGDGILTSRCIVTEINLDRAVTCPSLGLKLVLTGSLGGGGASMRGGGGVGAGMNDGGGAARMGGRGNPGGAPGGLRPAGVGGNRPMGGKAGGAGAAGMGGRGNQDGAMRPTGVGGNRPMGENAGGGGGAAGMGMGKGMGGAAMGEGGCRCSTDSICSANDHHTEWCSVDTLETCEDAISDGGAPWSELACQQGNELLAGSLGSFELYDIVNDPAEAVDLASLPGHAQHLEDLQAYLACHLQSTDPNDPTECDPDSLVFGSATAGPSEDSSGASAATIVGVVVLTAGAIALGAVGAALWKRRHSTDEAATGDTPNGGKASTNWTTKDVGGLGERLGSVKIAGPSPVEATVEEPKFKTTGV